MRLLQGEAAIIADDALDLPAGEWDRLLTDLEKDVGFSQVDLDEHLGSPPIAADRATHVVMRSVIQHAEPSAAVVGEEATTEEWDQAVASQPGQLLFQLDAIDGSLPYETVTFGYSSNLLAYSRGRNQDQLLLAAVANSSGFTALYQQALGQPSGEVLVGRLGGEFKPLLDPLRNDVRAETVAVLGTTWKHRQGLLAVVDDPGFTVFTTGGAPAALGLITGRLAALVCTDPQTTHDTAYLPVLAALNIPIFTRTRAGLGVQALGLQDVLRFFSQVARSQQDRKAKPVPPFVAARNPQFARVLLDKLFLHPTDS